MKRTLIVATTSYAGMGPYVVNIVNCFHQDDPVFYFFCEYEDSYFKQNVKMGLRDKCTFFSLPNTLFHKIRDLVPIKKEYHKSVMECCKRKKIEVVHFINNPGDKLLIKDLNKKKIIVVSTVHDLHPHEACKEWYKELRFKIIYYYLYQDLIYGNNYITNSIYQFDELKSKYKEKRIYYHSFPSLVTDEIAHGNVVSSELCSLTKPYVLFFGRIEEYKGISLLIEAFINNAELRNNYTLVIAGGGALNKKDNDKVIGKKDIVFINRYINDNEVAFLYKNAKCVVYPYISATQSGVFSLAYFFKIPILASDVDFFKGIIKESESGYLFKKGDVNDLQNKLQIVLSTDQRETVDKGRRYYDSHFNIQAIRKSLLDIYNTTE